MTQIEKIKKAIEDLPEDDVWTLGEWLDELKAQLWDAQMERDAAAGKLDKMAERARENYRAGRYREL
jgi:hypothetical protein